MEDYIPNSTKFGSFTSEEIMRHPAYIGFRERNIPGVGMCREYKMKCSVAPAGYVIETVEKVV
jgi:hypothetical protein